MVIKLLTQGTRFMKRVKVRVPASSANLGPGFDCLGVALKLYNEVELVVGGDDKKDFIEIVGEGADTLPRDKRNIVYQAAKVVFNKLRFPIPDFRLNLVNCIPIARGLGSSAAAIVGGLAAANMVCGNKLSEQEIIDIATKMERHPDNVVPAVKGGLCVSVLENKKVKYIKLAPPRNLVAVVCIPDFEVSTQKAREVLPKIVALSDAVFNSSRVALLLASLLKNEYNNLDLAMEDKLHQSYRAKLVPGLGDVLSSARRAGAAGVALSGSGPTVIALTEKKKTGSVGQTMKKVFGRHKIKSKYLILDFDNEGVRKL